MSKPTFRPQSATTNELSTAVLHRMQALLPAHDYNAYLDALKNPPLRTARKNPLKDVPDALLFAELGGFPLLPPQAKPGRGALHAAGAYYVQEPAAAAVANLLAPVLPSNATVLDMCAAPGGKVTAVASARDDCTFLANEIVFSRAKILLSNVERLGLRNCTVTSLHPDDIAERGGHLFDAVIADVPCSGEGMVRKTDFGESDLSDEAVNACAVRARKILDACDRCLKPNGILLFSTCTFNRTENEEQVLHLMRDYGYTPVAPAVRPLRSRHGFDLDEAVRFFPQDGGGEGHFACLLRKSDSAINASRNRKAKQTVLPAKQTAAVCDTLTQITAEKFAAARIVPVGEGCEFLPDDYPFAAFPALRRGMRLADFVSGRIVPHHHFATAAKADLLLDAPDYPPQAQEIAAYLCGNEFACNQKSGFRVLKVASLPLGLIKISNGVAKNRYPKGLRL